MDQKAVEERYKKARRVLANLVLAKADQPCDGDATLPIALGERTPNASVVRRARERRQEGAGEANVTLCPHGDHLDSSSQPGTRIAERKLDKRQSDFPEPAPEPLHHRLGEQAILRSEVVADRREVRIGSIRDVTSGDICRRVLSQTLERAIDQRFAVASLRAHDRKAREFPPFVLTSNLNICIDTFMMPSNSHRPRAEFWAPRYVLGRSVRQMIAGLDPDEHDAEITHLSTEVLTPPMMAHIGYANAAARTVAVPHVARTVFREGTGDQIVHPWKRDADTLTFFGELIRRGHRSAEGMAACERIQQIHRAVGGIRNKDKIYTLSLMASSPRDLAMTMGRPIHSDVENRAQHNFWLGVGRAMQVRDVPETPEELQAWTDEYETKHFEPSPEAHEVGEAHIRAIEHWFPGPSKWLARRIFIGSLDVRVAECLGYEPTKKPFAMLMRTGWLSFATATPILPMRLDSSWVKSFSRVGAKPDLERIGYGTYADAQYGDARDSQLGK